MIHMRWRQGRFGRSGETLVPSPAARSRRPQLASGLPPELRRTTERATRWAWSVSYTHLTLPTIYSV